jgi:hypothetical protein
MPFIWAVVAGAVVGGTLAIVKVIVQAISTRQ